MGIKINRKVLNASKLSKLYIRSILIRIDHSKSKIISRSILNDFFIEIVNTIIKSYTFFLKFQTAFKFPVQQLEPTNEIFDTLYRNKNPLPKEILKETAFRNLVN